MTTSVLISTYNRYEKLLRCLESILSNIDLPEEVIIVDQSGGDISRKISQHFSNPRIVFLTMEERGITKGRNYAIQQAKGFLLIFTGDDCIVPRDWIKKIKRLFRNKPETVLFFGQVLPYYSGKIKELENNCPSTRIGKRSKTILPQNFSGIKDTDYLLSNNFVCKRELFRNVGLLMPWLGAGSIGKSSEDNELCLRLLINNISYTYDPNIRVFHNHWIDDFSYYKLYISYSRGWVAMWIYYYFLTSKFRHLTLRVLLPVLKTPYQSIKSVSAINSAKSVKDRLIDVYLGIYSLYEIIFGLLLGSIQYFNYKTLMLLRK